MSQTKQEDHRVTEGHDNVSALPANQILLGGQAVIEGVMMRGPESIATAVRRKDGSITIHKEPFVPLALRSRFWSIPVIRGIGGFFEMLSVGIRMLNFSASVAMQDLEAGNGAGSPAKPKRKTNERVGTAVAFGVSLVLAVGLFFVVPLVVATALFDVSQEPLAFNLLAGGIRLMIFLGYLAAIAQLPDVRRLFMYHGAEHMTVFAYERTRTMSVEAARTQSRFHPRCGTSFLLIVVVASIIVFAVADTVILALLGTITLPLRLLWHLVLLPLIAGASYEVIRYSARHAGTLVGRCIVAPGLLLQRLTTRVPTEDQLAVAVAALTAALETDVEPAEESALAQRDVNYA